MRVSKIKVSSSHFGKLLETDANLKKCLQYLPDGVNAKDLLPKGKQMSLDFVLMNTNSAFANALRTALVEESTVQSLEVKKLDTDDKFIIYDHIVKRIEAIPIQQGIVYNKPITINITNETRDFMPVLSKDIKIDGKFNNSRFFEDTIQIIKLNPGKSLKIVMNAVYGDGREDSNKFSNVANVRYAPGNEPLDEATGRGKSSLESNSTTFSIGVTTYRNNSLKNIMYNAIKSLYERLDIYSSELKNVTTDGKKISYRSKKLVIQTFGPMYLFELKGEFRSIPGMISKNCYELCPSIPFVVPTIKHRSIECGYIKIVHPSPIKLIQAAIDKAKKDLDVLKKEFKDL